MGSAFSKYDEVPIAEDGSYSYIVPEFVTDDYETNTFRFYIEINPDGGIPDTTYACFDFPVPSHIDDIGLCNLTARGEYEIDLLLRR